MTARNDVTGDLIKSKSSEAYRSNYDAIFRKPKAVVPDEQPDETQNVDASVECTKNCINSRK